MISVVPRSAGSRRLLGMVALATILFYLALGVVAGKWIHAEVYDAANNAVRFASSATPWEVRFCRCEADQVVELETSWGLPIAGSMYGADADLLRPGILLLHGNTPRGRQLPLYRVLAQRLSDQGYAVLTIDLAGFGESGDPFSLGEREAVDSDQDVRAALMYLKSLDSVDPDRIYLVSHSGGAIGAFSAGTTDPDVAGIVAIGPPRRVGERLLDPVDRSYWWERARDTRQAIFKADFPSWYTESEFYEYRQRTKIDNYKEYFSGADHKPLLLIDGELESQADRDYLSDYYDSISDPKRYVTIPDSDHYANSRSHEMLGLLFYDGQAVSAIVREIDRWIRHSS